MQTSTFILGVALQSTASSLHVAAICQISHKHWLVTSNVYSITAVQMISWCQPRHNPVSEILCTSHRPISPTVNSKFVYIKKSYLMFNSLYYYTLHSLTSRIRIYTPREIVSSLFFISICGQNLHYWVVRS